jgi:hypothetical protein
MKKIYLLFFRYYTICFIIFIYFANPRNEDNALITKNNAEKVNKNSSKSELEESITKVNNQNYSRMRVFNIQMMSLKE